jgi:formylglycine-generating enzyme required for sulfatase activity
MGNIWTWCCNQVTPNYQPDHRAVLFRDFKLGELHKSQFRHARLLLAVRGGSFNRADVSALAACRGQFPYDAEHQPIGLRWQMSRPISGR